MSWGFACVAAAELTGDFYAACMDQAAVDRAGLAPIEHLLVDLAGGRIAWKMVQSDPHPIAKFRVIGPLSNLPEFRATFHCAEGMAMVCPDAVRREVW